MSSAGSGAAHLARLVRYPVKGFSGQDLDAALLQPGRGLPHDRTLAITNGTTDVTPDGQWTACQAFIRLTTNTDLPRYRLRFETTADGADAGVMSLSGPDGHRLQARPGDPQDLLAVNEVLGRWFPRGPLGPPQLSRARHGLWDHQDAVPPPSVVVIST